MEEGPVVGPVEEGSEVGPVEEGSEVGLEVVPAGKVLVVKPAKEGSEVTSVGEGSAEVASVEKRSEVRLLEELLKAEEGSLKLNVKDLVVGGTFKTRVGMERESESNVTKHLSSPGNSAVLLSKE